MGYCAVPGCKNNTRCHVKMNTVPKDKIRQTQWVKNAGLDVTQLNKKLFICEYHFTSDMWEKVRVDGKKKLKRTAVPTIFGDLVTQIKYSSLDAMKANKKPIQSLSVEPAKQIITIYDASSKNIIIEECSQNVSPNNTPKTINITKDIRTDASILRTNNQIKQKNHNYSHVKSITNDTADIFTPDNQPDESILINNNQVKQKDDNSNVELTTEDIADDITKDSQINTSILSQKKQRSYLDLLKYVKNLKARLERSTNQIFRLTRNQQCLRNKVKYQARKIEQLESGLNTDAVKKFFNNDQIQIINGYKKSPQWSDNTIMKALQLRLTCGISGYKKLLQNKHPLPSLRTLSRRLNEKK